MKQRLIGFQELLPNHVDDAYLLALNPAAHVVFQGGVSVTEARDRALHVKALLPDCRVILRLTGDNDQSGVALVTDPRAAAASLYARYRPALDKRLIAFFDNEPGVNSLDRRVAFWYALMDLAGADGFSIVYAAFSTGTPDIPDYPSLLPAFRRAFYWKQRSVPMYWGAHGYFDPGDRILKPDGGVEFDNGLYWHIDRPRREAAQVCAAAGIASPDLIMTEIGVAVGYDAHRGYKSPGGLSGRDYAQRLTDFQLPFASTVFCWGSFGGWDSFDPSGDQEFKNTLLAQPLTELSEEPQMSFDYGTMYEAEVTSAFEPDGSTVRSGAGTNFAPVVSLHQGDTITISEHGQQAGGYLWYRVTKGIQTGYVAKTAVLTWLSKTSAPVPITPEQLNHVKDAALAARDALSAAQGAVEQLIASLPT